MRSGGVRCRPDREPLCVDKTRRLSRASRFGSISLAVMCAPSSSARVLPPAPAHASRTWSPGCFTARRAAASLHRGFQTSRRCDGVALSLCGHRSSRDVRRGWLAPTPYPRRCDDVTGLRRAARVVGARRRRACPRVSGSIRPSRKHSQTSGGRLPAWRGSFASTNGSAAGPSGQSCSRAVASHRRADSGSWARSASSASTDPRRRSAVKVAQRAAGDRLSRGARRAMEATQRSATLHQIESAATPRAASAPRPIDSKRQRLRTGSWFKSDKPSTHLLLFGVGILCMPHRLEPNQRQDVSLNKRHSQGLPRSAFVTRSTAGRFAN